MEQCIKSAAPPSFIAAVQRIEDQADDCYRGLALLRWPENLASWAVLTVIIHRTECVVAEHAMWTPAHEAALLNMSRAGAQAINWLQKSVATFSPRRSLKLDDQLFIAADQAVSAAHSYDAFTSSFPLWHKNYLEAQLVEPSVVRFIGLDGENSRRVRAYQQGLRPAGSRPKLDSSLQFSPGVAEQIKQKIVNLVRSGSEADDPFSFFYGKPKRLWRTVYQTQLDSMNTLFRRSDSLGLGGYSIGEFKRFYAGLLAICAVHENACDLRGQMQQKYPLDSAVLLNNRRQWIELLSEITSLKSATIDSIIRDLTFGETKVMDLCVHPFIPLNENADLLGVVPHFPLVSRADENLIRVCSHLRPQIHSVLAHNKEDEMRDRLIADKRPELRLRGPRMLPKALPDIDLIVEDPTSSTIMIAELKWLRKTIRPTEHCDREAEFLNCVTQLKAIEEFVKANPGFLLARGDVSQDLAYVRNLHFVVVARDYFVWVDPTQGYPVIDYEPFLEMVKTPGPLDEQIRKLTQFNWLPVEGRDFRSSYERSTVNGVTAESEIFYANY